MKRILTVALAVMLCSALLLSGCGDKQIATKNEIIFTFVKLLDLKNVFFIRIEYPLLLK